jgi:hypothetical protein
MVSIKLLTSLIYATAHSPFGAALPWMICVPSNYLSRREMNLKDRRAIPGARRLGLRRRVLLRTAGRPDSPAVSRPCKDHNVARSLMQSDSQAVCARGYGRAPLAHFTKPNFLCHACSAVRIPHALSTLKQCPTDCRNRRRHRSERPVCLAGERSGLRHLART